MKRSYFVLTTNVILNNQIEQLFKYIMYILCTCIKIFQFKKQCHLYLYIQT
jgi:hypothetical protein